MPKSAHLDNFQLYIKHQSIIKPLASSKEMALSLQAETLTSNICRFELIADLLRFNQSFFHLLSKSIQVVKFCRVSFNHTYVIHIAL